MDCLISTWDGPPLCSTATPSTDYLAGRVSGVLKQSDCADMLSFAADCSHRLERSSQNILLLRSSDFCAFERQSSARLRNSLAFELGMADPHYLLDLYRRLASEAKNSRTSRVIWVFTPGRCNS